MDDIYIARLQSACRGEREAIDWLMAAERSWLLARCRRMLPKTAANLRAEDLVQECSLSFLKGHQSLSFEARAAFRAWLLKVARNHWLNSRGPLGAADDDLSEELPASEEGLRWPLASHAVHDLRKGLPLRQDAAIMLRDYCGCSFDLIAEVLDCPSLTAARSLRARALRAMAQAASEQIE